MLQNWKNFAKGAIDHAESKYGLIFLGFNFFFTDIMVLSKNWLIKFLAKYAPGLGDEMW